MNPLLRGTAAAALLLALNVKAQETTGTTTASPSATQACPTVLTPSYPAPVVARGWKAQLIATGLSRPRSIKFDTNGALLVLEAGKGLTHLTFTDDGGTCLSLQSNTSLITDGELNHGLELSEDGQTIYVSTQEYVDSYSYDVDAVSLENPTRLVANMTNPGTGHVSRTLLLSKKQPGLLLVSRGSATNIDPLAADESTGVSQVRAFNISSAADLERPYSYPTDGLLVGWGLRNSVGVAEHPVTGGVYSVENSADNVVRLSTDIHEDNPGEELNFHGFLDDASTLGANHGYPACFALWNTTRFPSLGDDLTVGSQFSLDNNATHNDTDCARRTTAPRLTFQAHTAPLDIKFSPSGDAAFISFHGSWNRAIPVGYKLSLVSFAADRGEPAEPPDSVTAARDVMTAPDVSACSAQGGRGAGCFRPVGLAFDAAGERLFLSSDATGEIWVVMRDGAGGGGGGGGDGGATGTDSGASTTSTGAAAGGLRYQGFRGEGWAVVLLTAIMMAAGGLVFVG